MSCLAGMRIDRDWKRQRGEMADFIHRFSTNSSMVYTKSMSVFPIDIIDECTTGDNGKQYCT